jgi:hypothetical protein
MPNGVIYGVAFFGLIAIAFAVILTRKIIQARRVKKWPSTTGTIAISRVEARKRVLRDAGESEFVNEPRVEYDYSIGKHKYRGKRIGLAERISPMEIESVLARYPVGATVTVYYNPANHSDALLDRELPRVVLLAGIGCLAVIIGGPLIAAVVYFNGVAWLENHVARPSTAPFVAAAAGFGIAAALFAIGYTRLVFQSRRWPTVPGQITAAGTEGFRDHDDLYTRQILYKSCVQYTYEVNGRQYTGDRVSLGVTIASTLPGMARRMAAKYKVGGRVQVYHNPKDPTDCCLNPRSHWYLLAWAVAIAMLTLAWAVATGRV